MQPSKRVIVDMVRLLDFVCIAFSSLLAHWIYLSVYLNDSDDQVAYVTVGVLAAFLSVTTLRRQGIYSIETLSKLRGQVGRLIIGVCIAFVLLLTAGYLLKISDQFSRGWMMLWFVISVFALLCGHFFVARLLQRWKSFGLFARNVAVYGSGDIARQIVEQLSAQPQDTRVLGVFDDLRTGVVPSVVVAGGVDDLINIGQTHRFDEIIVAIPSADEKRIVDIVTKLSVLPVSIRLCPDAIGFRLRPTGIVNYEGVSMLELVRAPMDNWAPILKDVEDRILASMALVFAMPLMLLVALAIKIDSPGPVFFRQKRHGFNHQVISVVKFRSMNVAQDGAYVPQAQRNDPRVTRVGRFLRSASLDELPQLLNVIRGEMSLVGPRPHAIAHNEYYSTVLARYATRHKVKPGITGWAQVNGCRGETDVPEKMRKRVEYDLYYIENWSLWLDIKILLLTPIFGVFGANAF